jgi:hypothetical protein
MPLMTCEEEESMVVGVISLTRGTQIELHINFRTILALFIYAYIFLVECQTMLIMIPDKEFEASKNLLIPQISSS